MDNNVIDNAFFIAEVLSIIGFFVLYDNLSILCGVLAGFLPLVYVAVSLINDL